MNAKARISMDTTKPTLKTIANITGLAVTTVSRALKGEPEIAAETRQRVRTVADQIGYVPDRAAQRLRTGRTNVISFVLEPHDEMLNFGSMMIAGLMTAFRDTPYHLLVTPQFKGMDPLVPIRHIVRNHLADGIVFCRTTPSDERAKMLLENEFPFISHGRTEFGTAHPYVDFDNYEFAQRAVGKLIAQGFRKLVLINAPALYAFSRHMRDGFVEAAREHGIDHSIAEAVSIESPPERIRKLAMEYIRTDQTDGFVCGGEVSAMAVLAAVADHGLAANRDIGIFAKQTTPLFDQIRPRIGTVYEDLEVAGRKLGELLLQRINGATAEQLNWLEHGTIRQFSE